MKNITQKILYITFFILFILFSIKNAEEYITFHTEKRQNIEYQKSISDKLEKFSISDIKEISNLSVYRTADLSLLDKIVQEIDTANSRIYLETYILTEKRVQEALKKAFYRWVDVQVVLEKNPYMAYSINNKSYNNLYNAWIPIAWSDPQDFSLNHSKFIIVDSHFYISTWNFSYSTFKYNRDFFMKSNDPAILSILIEIFQHDFIWDEKNFYHPNIVLSPFSSRHYFYNYFQSAQKSIYLYFQYFKDDALVNLLVEKQKEWVEIIAIIPETALESNKEIIEQMEKNGIIFHVMKKKKMHAKVIIIDELYWFIWSINFSSFSLDKNRELWLLFYNQNIIKEMIDYFQDDIANNTVKK